jgi:hypothetical protein
MLKGLVEGVRADTAERSIFMLVSRPEGMMDIRRDRAIMAQGGLSNYPEPFALDFCFGFI